MTSVLSSFHSSAQHKSPDSSKKHLDTRLPTAYKTYMILTGHMIALASLSLAFQHTAYSNEIDETVILEDYTPLFTPPSGLYRNYPPGNRLWLGRSTGRSVCGNKDTFHGMNISLSWETGSWPASNSPATKRPNIHYLQNKNNLQQKSSIISTRASTLWNSSLPLDRQKKKTSSNSN